MVRLTLVLMMVLAGVARAADEDYKPCPEATPRADVPKGVVTKYEWATSKVFEGTVRDYWVYVPSQYKAESPANVMVFQDGHAYIGDKGDFRAATVFDNLIAAGEMPVTVGIFINPGAHPAKQTEASRKSAWNADNRSFEYDTLGDRYSRFLIDEILPEVGKTVKLTDDPEKRAICGMSSGGICAFTVAWQRPDAFRKVLSHIGSFTAIAYRAATADRAMQVGGDLYPTLIRKTPIKPLRVFLQDGANDLDNEHGNWFLANRQMLSALNWANANADKRKVEGPRYDAKAVWGEGKHSGKHGGAIFADSLRWLWREGK
jgi:enterochelin esterase family protein